MGIEAHLGNETRCAGIVLSDGAPQRFAVTDQGVEALGHPRLSDAAITRLVGSQLLEQQEAWQLERQRFFYEATMAKIPETEEPFVLTEAALAGQAAATTG